jgi:prepilin signal peptidase PulO-like enzyme (type II secretory pathway)
MGLRLAALFVVGTFLGSLVNWAIYTFAWNARPISPWSPPPAGVPPRSWFDRVPILGWLKLKREAAIHGRWFWLRPLVLELSTGAAVAGLYWWEIAELGLIRGQLPGLVAVPLIPVHLEYASHVLLLCLMLAASFIDIDEKTIPDAITVPGTILGLALATVLPTSLLPHVDQRAVPPVVGVEIANADGGAWYLEPMTAISPRPWPPAWGAAGEWRSLVIALGCYWLWCFALAPRIWRGRRGPVVALRLIAARLNREFTRPPLRWFLMWGTAAIVFVWALAAQRWRFALPAWTGMLTALIGLAASGGLVWAIRRIGTFSLKREAMGFGDVTLMMMIGTFLGWQAGLVLFFLAPFAGLVIGLLQLVFRRDDVIPYGPFLCLAAAVCVVGWASVWMWAQPIFGLGWLVPAMLIVCLAMLGVMLTIWQAIKTALFRRGA